MTVTLPAIMENRFCFKLIQKKQTIGKYIFLDADNIVVALNYYVHEPDLLHLRVGTGILVCMESSSATQLLCYTKKRVKLEECLFITVL